MRGGTVRWTVGRAGGDGFPAADPAGFGGGLGAARLAGTADRWYFIWTLYRFFDCCNNAQSMAVVEALKTGAE